MNNNQFELRSLLADSLREKPSSYIIDQIFSLCRTREELIEVTEQELTSIKGIGHMKARQILAALKLAQVLAVTSPPICKIRSPEDVYNLIEPEFRYLQKEHFVVILLNSKNAGIATELISIGSLNACLVRPLSVVAHQLFAVIITLVVALTQVGKI